MYHCINSTAKSQPADSVRYIPAYCSELVLCISVCCLIQSGPGIFVKRSRRNWGGESGLNLTEKKKKREEVCVWYLGEKDNGLSHSRKEAHVAPLTDKVTQN